MIEHLKKTITLSSIGNTIELTTLKENFLERGLTSPTLTPTRSKVPGQNGRS